MDPRFQPSTTLVPLFLRSIRGDLPLAGVV